MRQGHAGKVDNCTVYNITDLKYGTNIDKNDLDNGTDM